MIVTKIFFRSEWTEDVQVVRARLGFGGIGGSLRLRFCNILILAAVTYTTFTRLGFGLFGSY